MNANQALSVLHSWLQSVGIATETWDNESLVIRPYAEVELHVSVVPDRAAGLCIDGAKLLSTDRNEALAEFHVVTRFLGMGEPDPAIRPEADGRSKDFDLIAMRHCEFRNAPNPSNEDIKKYEKVVNNCVKRFYVSNKSICGYSYMEEEDLKSYAMVWMCNFIHKYQLLNAPDVENFKLLNYHIQQRFSKLRSDMYRRQRSTRPDVQAVELSLGKTSLEVLSTHWTDSTGEGNDANCPALRRTDAAALLAKKLTDLPHDEMIERLTEVATSEWYGHADDTKKVAQKLLDRHRLSCPECLALQSQE